MELVAHYISEHNEELHVYEDESGWYLSDPSVNWNKKLFGEKNRLSTTDIEDYVDDILKHHPIRFQPVLSIHDGLEQLVVVSAENTNTASC